MLLLIQLLSVGVLIMILACLFSDEKKSRLTNMRIVKLKGYWDGSDRRSADRFEVNLPVRYYLNGNDASAKGVDISTKGIKLLLDEKFKKDTPLRLEIKLAGYSDLIRAWGVVAWSSEAAEENKKAERRLFNTGIKFTRFHDAGEKKLFDFIAQVANTP